MVIRVKGCPFLAGAAMGVAIGTLPSCTPPAPGTYCQSGPKYGTQCYYSAGNGDGFDPARGQGENPNARLIPIGAHPVPPTPNPVTPDPHVPKQNR